MVRAHSIHLYRKKKPTLNLNTVYSILVKRRKKKNQMCRHLLFRSRNFHFKNKHCTHKSIGWGNNLRLYCLFTYVSSKHCSLLGPLWGPFSYWPVTGNGTLESQHSVYYCPTWRGLCVYLPSFYYQLAFLMWFTQYLVKNLSANFKNWTFCSELIFSTPETHT